MRNDSRGFAIDAENTPLNRAGLYRITHLVSGKTYIGISKDLAKRAKQHTFPRGATKLANAVRLYGVSGFLFEPLFYCLSGQTDFSFLPELEAAQIIEHDSIRAGYNIIEACGRVGPYGPEFAKTVAAAHARRTPEERSAIVRRAKASISPERLSEIGRRNATTQSPEIRSARAKQVRDRQTPERRIEVARAAGLASAQAIASDPALVAARRDAGRKLAAIHTPEKHRDRYAQGHGLGSMTAEQLRTAGLKGASVANANRTPEERRELAQKAARARLALTSEEDRKALARKAGARGGATHAAKTFEERSAIAKKIAESRRANGTNITNTKGSRWINDGASHRRLKDGDTLPDGWSFGHLGKNRADSN